MKNNFSIVFSAPSGAGKSTIIARVLGELSDIAFVTSSTTRKPRPNEIDGVDYYFMDQDDFLAKASNDEFLEWAIVHSNYYGTLKKEVDRIVRDKKIPLFDVDVQGALNLRRVLPGAVFIFVLPPSMAELEKRLRDRKTESDEQLTLRLANARCEVRELGIFDYVVVNNDISESIKDVEAIIRAERLRLSRMREYIELMGFNQ